MSGLVNKLCFPKERVYFNDVGYSKHSLKTAVGPTLLLNFLENPTTENHGVTITVARTSTSATYFDQDGVLQSAAANTARFNHDPATGACLGLLVEAGATQVTLNTGTWGNNTAIKFVYAYGLNDCAASFNGAAIQTDTGATMPTVTIMRLGVSHASTSQLMGHIRRIMFWNYRLNNQTIVQVAT